MAHRPIKTDELVDRLFSRPVAWLLVRPLIPTPVTANQVTYVACLSGIPIGVSLALGCGLLAAICVAAYLVLDCMDGQLARVRGGGGYLGRAMDGWSDYVAGVALHLGLMVWIAEGQGWIAAVALTLMAAGGMTWASFLLDRYKRRYSDSTGEIDAIKAEAAERGGFAGKLIMWMVPYAEKLDGGVVVPDTEAYQVRVRWPMRLWLLGGPTMHVTALAVCAAFDRPALYAFIAVGPMLVLTLLTLWLQHRAESREPSVVQTRED